MYIQLNEGESQEIEKYKRQLASLYESYKKLQKMLMKKNQKNDQLMGFIERMRVEFNKRNNKITQLRKENEELKYKMSKQKCPEIDIDMINYENKSSNVLQTKRNKSNKSNKSGNSDKNTLCKKSRRKGKENQIEVLNAPRFDTINSEISFKKQKSNDEVKELDLKVSSLEGQIKELEKVILEQNSCLLYTSPSPRDLSTSRMPSSA